MNSGNSATNTVDSTLYELRAIHSFIDGRPVSAGAARRIASAPAILVMPHEVTLILRNIPSSVDEERMETVLRQHGFAGSYNYLFLPLSRRGSNLGFVVVNFVQKQDALRFAAVFHGSRFPGATTMRPCSVILADLQGREANVSMNARYGGRATR
eukprot:TRINITY_DN7148_c0_g3_i1.p1 TRINITY_DN7148_c0_g3~~TRINITY_DN7148_c0_g3_i1.p1  ORF type:complete len:155 (-),score=24.19 TRINITY_DN7148_c0_g3_i1:550-1014(-)